MGKFLVPNFCIWYQKKKKPHPSNIWCSDPKTVGNPWKNLIKFYGICPVQMNPAPTPEINVGANSHTPPTQMVPECSSTRRVRLDGSCCFVSHPTLRFNNHRCFILSWYLPSARGGECVRAAACFPVILLCAPTRLPRPVALALTALQLKIRTSWMSTLQQEKKKQQQEEQEEEEQQQQRRQ